MKPHLLHGWVPGERVVDGASNWHYYYPKPTTKNTDLVVALLIRPNGTSMAFIYTSPDSISTTFQGEVPEEVKGIDEIKAWALAMWRMG